ncbi:MAG: GDP-L-fucose synthase [Gammaproteobacteria bacterium]
MELDQKIYVAGHRGLVGSAIMRCLASRGYTNLITATSAEVDLRNQSKARSFFKEQTPEYVIIAAAKVGGILANDRYPADFIFDNLMIAANVIDAAHQYGVKKLLFLGSTCVYPKLAPQPLKEEYLLTGPLEPTNEWYAIAKIAGIKMCQAYRRQYGCQFVSAMPTNLYGSEDNFNLESSHVLPALIRKFYEAKQTKNSEVVVWGTGKPRREFLHVDDLADASLFLMQNYNGEEAINIGVGEDISIADLAETIRDIIGYKGSIVFDRDKPDGTPRKLVDTSLINSIGWSPKISLGQGILSTVKWYTKMRESNVS